MICCSLGFHPQSVQEYIFSCNKALLVDLIDLTIDDAEGDLLEIIYN
jgi:hypothetical protein